MCVIFVADTERPTADELKQAQESNPDGIGVAWRDTRKGYVRWLKGLKLKQAQEMAQTLPLPYAIHFRYATIGGKSEQLTHPFPIEYKVRLDLMGSTDRGLIMHNGTWIMWDRNMPEKVLKKGLWSDSRAIAWLLARAEGDEAFQELLVEHIPGKFAHITADGIEIYGGFDTVRPGLTASNLYWRRISPTRVHKHYAGKSTPVYGEDWESYRAWYEAEAASKAADEAGFNSWLKARAPTNEANPDKEVMEDNPNFEKIAGVWRHKKTHALADNVSEFFLEKGYKQDAKGVWHSAQRTFPPSTEQGSATLGKDTCGVINLHDYQARVKKAREQAAEMSADIAARLQKEQDLRAASVAASLGAALPLTPEYDVDEVEAGLSVVAASEDVQCNDCGATVATIDIRGHNHGCPVMMEAKAMDQGSGARIDEASGQVTWPGYETFEKELNSGWD